MAHQDLGLLALQDFHLQSLLHGHHAGAISWIEQEGHRAPALQTWLSLYLKLPLTTEQLSTLPHAYQRHWQGWRDYYAGNLIAAAQALHHAFDELDDSQEQQQLRADTALGLGKVYTRTGHWQAARAWLLHALYLARRADRQFDILRGYGALGELLLRAGHPKAAHACMSTSYHLLPPGKGQQAKQLNYLATALMRSQASLRAESLLMTALFMARDAGDQASRLHALARLQFLRWDTAGTDQCNIIDELGETLPDHVTPAATGFIYLGQALRSWPAPTSSLQATTAAVDKLQRAYQAFGQALPTEQAWSQQLIHRLEGSTYTLSPHVSECLALTPRPPPSIPAVLDATWQRLPISVANGFQWLAYSPGEAGFPNLRQQRQCFFI